LHVHRGDSVSPGDPLFTVHAESPGELDYAFEYIGQNGNIIMVEPA
ncbi:MAG: hypothetical protein D6763_00685, partial [Alphaproteobacteria bacterium]